MYAIIAESGKQFKVTSGDVIRIDREVDTHDDLTAVKTITFDRVLLVGGDGDAKIGAPTVVGATVTGDVLRSVKSKKVEIIKYKRRKGYHLHKGHRQTQVEVRITAINA